MKINIRAETDADREAIWKVNAAAFGGPAEPDLVDALRAGGFVEVSLVAEIDGQIVGHILFSRVSIQTKDGAFAALSLAPMAIVPERQMQGIGTQLIKAGLKSCRKVGHKIVVVLGHPTYYPKFGFSSELAKRLISPFGGEDAWMALELVPDAMKGIEGTVEYSAPFTAFS